VSSLPGTPAIRARQQPRHDLVPMPDAGRSPRRQPWTDGGPL